MGWFSDAVNVTTGGGLLQAESGYNALGGSGRDAVLGGASGEWLSGLNGGMGNLTGTGDWSLGGLTGSNATRDAANMQAEATREANATQRYMYDTSRSDLQPWRQAGMGALTGLGGSDFQRDFNMGDFQADPGYQFRLAEGEKAINRAASARGGRSSGATMKALSRFNQDSASNEFNNAYSRFNSDRDRRFNRLASLAGIGQTANGQMGAVGQNYANQVSANQTGMGNANAAARMQQQQGQNQMIGNGLMAYAMMA